MSEIDFNYLKLSGVVDDFLVDNISNMTSNFTSLSTNEITCYVDKLSIYQYFPRNDYVKPEKLKIDEVGKYSITLPKKADTITKIIESYCNCSNDKITITDATAGVGGNVLSFCKYGFKVNAVEIDKDRYDILRHNINEYKYNVKVVNNNYLSVINKLNQDVIFVDPPWGGINYKKHDEITLKLDDMSIEDLCKKISDEKLAKLTVLKLPFNYNLNHIKHEIHLPFTIIKLKNILVVVIFNNI
jgi:predicted RNA methylase